MLPINFFFNIRKQNVYRQFNIINAINTFKTVYIYKANHVSVLKLMYFITYNIGTHAMYKKKQKTLKPDVQIIASSNQKQEQQK